MAPPNPQLTAQLQHLWAASHALAATSPAVSAHLMTRVFKLSADRELNLSESTMRKACKACGTVQIPGWNSHVYTTRDHRVKKRKPSKRQVRQKETIPSEPVLHPENPSGDRASEVPEISKLRVIYECQACGRSNEEIVPPPRSNYSTRSRSRLATNHSAVLSAQSSSSTTTPGEIRPEPAPPSTPMPSQNVGSRKRAKSRKGNSLSDILAAKKKQDSSGVRNSGVGFGLDLMDLMKTG